MLYIEFTPAATTDGRNPGAFRDTYQGNLRLTFDADAMHHTTIVEWIDRDPDVTPEIPTDNKVVWLIGLDEKRPFTVDAASQPATRQRHHHEVSRPLRNGVGQVTSTILPSLPPAAKRVVGGCGLGHRDTSRPPGTRTAPGASSGSTDRARRRCAASAFCSSGPGPQRRPVDPAALAHEREQVELGLGARRRRR